MARALGAALVLGACAYLGLRLAGELRARVRLLGELCDRLALLRSDVVFRLLPLPEALSHAGFGALTARLAQKQPPPLETLWHDYFATLEPLAAEPRAALDALGAQLGKYDAEAQRAALDACIEALRAAQTDARALSARRGRLYSGLGLTLGLLVAVTLY